MCFLSYWAVVCVKQWAWPMTCLLFTIVSIHRRSKNEKCTLHTNTVTRIQILSIMMKEHQGCDHCSKNYLWLLYSIHHTACAFCTHVCLSVSPNSFNTSKAALSPWLLLFTFSTSKWIRIHPLYHTNIPKLGKHNDNSEKHLVYLMYIQKIQSSL